MDYFVQGTITIAFAAMLISLYLFRLRIIRKKGWEAAKNESHEEVAAGFMPGGKEVRWLFAGPPSNKIQDQHQRASHHPIYLLRLLNLFVVRMPPFVFRTVISSLKSSRLCYVPEISDADIYDIFIHGPLVLMAEVNKELIGFELPNMPLQTLRGTNPGGLQLVFHVPTKSIHRAEWKGQDIKEDKGLIASLLVITLAMWAHPQTHIASEQSAREIAEKGIEVLEPSNRFVVAVHDGLFYGTISPLTKGHPLSIQVDAESGVKSAIQFKITHDLDTRKKQFRYYRFLWEARKILMQLLRTYRIAVNPEWLFNNMIVHSVDHHFLFQNLSKIDAWSLDGGARLRSYWRSQIFVAVWVRHVGSPMEPEKIGKLSAKQYPFYAALYTELKQVDKELADCILASTSF